MSCGLKLRMKTTVPSTSGGMLVAMDCPNRWLSGSRFRKRSGRNGRAYGLYFATSVATGTRLASRFLWRTTTPLGSAVAPDVNTIWATSSRVIGGPASGRRRSNRTRRSGQREPGRIRRTARGRRHRRPTRYSTSLAPTMRGDAARRSSATSGSRSGQPSRRQSPRPSSRRAIPAEFSPQSSILSPAARPAPSSRRANPRAARVTCS